MPLIFWYNIYRIVVLEHKETYILDKIKIYISDNQEYIILESIQKISFSILREITGYKEIEENGAYIYHIPGYPTNMFILACLINKYKNIFDGDSRLFEAIKQSANSAPNPYCSLYGDNIKITCPSVDSYTKLMPIIGAKSLMMNSWRIPFTRLYESYNILKNWTHFFLPPFKIGKDLDELIHYPLTDKNDIESLMNIELSELYSVYYGWQVKPEGFKKLKYDTAVDILLTRPLRYQDRGDTIAWNMARFGKPYFIEGTLDYLSSSFDGKLTVDLICNKCNQKFTVTFWGNGWLTRVFKPGDKVVVQCTKIKKDRANGTLIISKEEAETTPIIPIYKQSPTNKINIRVITQCVREMFARFDGTEIANYISTSKPLWDLIYQLHFPKDVNMYSQTIDELAYIELVYLQLLFIEKRKNSIKHPGCSKVPLHETHYMQSAIESLPFELTKGQKEAIKVFIDKLQTNEPEKMLLSADVGAGKTLCAQIACLYTADSGFQSVLAGPTEILANQLYNTFIKLIEPLENKPNIAYLSGKTKAKEKREIIKGIAEGTIDILVGTHSVLTIEDWHNLGLVVIDEQQKFGAEQKEALLSIRKDGIMPDLISQTATPIPRSTALAFYGDIDLVPITEKPNNRLPIKTTLVDSVESEEFLKKYKGDEWDLILNELKQGHQMFIVAPAVDEEAKMISVNKIRKMLSRYNDIMTIEEISGKTSKSTQNKILEAFRNNEFNVLIASSIVEVGIDIPNATVMLVVGADRFGASSLHQIRGRVGRSDLQSYCFLVPDGSSDSSQKRLQSLVDSNDGFYIALSDLSTRKEGDLLGARQSGDSNLRFCELADHSMLIEKAQREAETIYANDELREKAIQDARCFLRQKEIE